MSGGDMEEEEEYGEEEEGLDEWANYSKRDWRENSIYKIYNQFALPSIQNYNFQYLINYKLLV